MKWQLLRCPDCRAGTYIYTKDDQEIMQIPDKHIRYMIQCPACSRYHSRLCLRQLYPEIGGLFEVSEEKAKKLDAKSLAHSLIMLADDLLKDNQKETA